MAVFSNKPKIIKYPKETAYLNVSLTYQSLEIEKHYFNVGVNGRTYICGCTRGYMTS